MSTSTIQPQLDISVEDYLLLAHKLRSAIVLQRPNGLGVVNTIKEAVRTNSFFKRCQVFTFGCDVLTNAFGIDSNGKLFVKNPFIWYQLAVEEPSVLIFDNVNKASVEEIAIVQALIIDAHRQENIVFPKDTLLMFSDDMGYPNIGQYYVERSCDMAPMLNHLFHVD